MELISEQHYASGDEERPPPNDEDITELGVRILVCYSPYTLPDADASPSACRSPTPR